MLSTGCVPVTRVPTPARSSPAPTRAASPEAAGTPAIPGLSWVTASAVARPEAAFAGASALPTVPTGPGTAGHPGHFPGQAVVDDVAQARGGPVAVGYVGINGAWTAIAWMSVDGDRWSIRSVDETPGSFAVSLAVDPRAGGRIVAGGRSGREPVTWDSADGRTWNRRTVPTLSAGAAWERIVTVVALGGEFIAGGSAGPELGDRHARFWRSTDGLAWESIPDDPSFAGAEVVSIAATTDGFVAVGRLGTGQRGSGSIAWVSHDGRAWRRVDSPDLAAGLVAAVAVGPDGSITAVGSDLDERAALVWRSTNGTSWALAPGEDSRLYNGAKIRMTDATALPGGGFLAVGNYVGVQYGTAASWTSSDGLTWQRAPRYPALEQGEMLAVAVGKSELLAVGSFGAPDNYIPTVWRSPLPNGS